MMAFYEEFAHEYDAVTGAAERMASAREWLEELRRREGFDSVLDAACGAGFHAVPLAEMGVRVVGADLSEEMLRQARQRAGEAGVEVQWLHCPMQRLTECVDGPFDAILCLGNSLPHLVENDDLGKALGAFAELLAPGGFVALQLLNYHRVLDRQQRLVGVTRSGDVEYIRFYDFMDEMVRFNLLRIQWKADGSYEHHLFGTPLRPYMHPQLEQALDRAGFDRVHAYAGTSFEPFRPNESDVLLMMAYLPA